MLHLVTVFDLRGANLALFDRYEDIVLPLLDDHDGLLMARVRFDDSNSEIHVIRFGSTAAYEGHRADPRRIAVAEMLELSRVRVTIVPIDGNSEAIV